MAAKKPAKGKSKKDTLVKQGAKFGLVGISNTVIDYTLFITITTLSGLPVEKSFMVKYFSGTVAMCNSFYWNRKWTFRSRAHLGKSAVKFLMTTLMSIWAIQPGMVFLFSGTDAGQAFGTFWWDLGKMLGIVGLAPNTFTLPWMIKTVAFGMGVVGSAIWNFTLYKLWAFKED